MSHMTTDEAIAYYGVARTDDPRADLIAALREAARRRQEGPPSTAALIRAAMSRLHMSSREIEAASVHPETGARIDHTTALRLVAKFPH